MKLFECTYLENNDEATYLTVGCDSDTEDSIKERELNKKTDWNCLYYFSVKEIREVDGYKVVVNSI